MSVSAITTTSTRRSKSRPAIIDLGDDDVSVTQIPPILSPASQTATAAAEAAALTEGNKDHLDTKRQIEEMRLKYGDKWLQNHGATHGGGGSGESTTTTLTVVDDNLLTTFSTPPIPPSIVIIILLIF